MVDSMLPDMVEDEVEDRVEDRLEEDRVDDMVQEIVEDPVVDIVEDMVDNLMDDMKLGSHTLDLLYLGGKKVEENGAKPSSEGNLPHVDCSAVSHKLAYWPVVDHSFMENFCQL